MIHGTEDFTLPNLLLQAASAGIVIGFLIHKKNSQFGGDLKSLLTLIVIVTTMQSICIVLDWWSPSIRSFIETLIVHPEQLETSAYRASGFSSNTGDGLAFLQAIGGAFCFVLLTKTSNQGTRLAWTLTFLLNVISIVFLARTGFVLLSVFLLSYLFLSGMKHRKIRSCLCLIGLLAAVGVGLYIARPEFVEGIIKSDQLRYSFEFMFKFAEEGKFETESSNELFSMFVLPQSDMELWFGSGYFKHMGMDPGYIRTISAVGLIGSAAIYGWYYLLWVSLKKYALNKETKVFITSFFALLFTSQLKFPFLYMTPTFLLISMLYWTLRGLYISDLATKSRSLLVNVNY